MSRVIRRLPWRHLAPRASARACLTQANAPCYSAVTVPCQLRYQSIQTQSVSTSNTPAQSATASASLIQLNVNGQVLSFSPLHLRDACQCEWCVDQHTRQKEFGTAEIPLALSASSVSFNQKDSVTEIIWENDIVKPHGYNNGGQHVSRYTAGQLILLATPFRATGDTITDFRYHWNGKIMERKQPWYSYNKYMTSKTTLFELVRSLHRVNSTPSEPARTNPQYVLRETWDVRSVPKAVNVAYTNKFLGFHMDLMYMREPPEFQLLHCMKNSSNGGESLFADTFTAAWKLYLTKPDMFWHLVNFPVHFGYDNHGHIYDYVRTTIELAPGAEKKRGSKERLKIEDIRYVNYAPPFQRPFYRQVGDDGQASKFNAELQAYRVAIHEFAKLINDPSMIFELKLRPGDCVIFHNRRAVHARKAFELNSPRTIEEQQISSGSAHPAERWLRGTYVDGDPVSSIMRLSKREEKEKWIAETGNEGLSVAEDWTGETGDPTEEGMRRLRVALKRYKQAPRSQRGDELLRARTALEEYLGWLIALIEGAGYDVGSKGNGGGAGRPVVLLKQEIEAEWSPVILSQKNRLLSFSSPSLISRSSKSSALGVANTSSLSKRAKYPGFAYELAYTLTTYAFILSNLARSRYLHTLYASQTPTPTERTASLQLCIREIQTAASIHSYICTSPFFACLNSSTNDNSCPPDVQLHVQSGLKSLCLAEATLLSISKDDAYLAACIQLRNKSDTDWMIRPPEIPRVRTLLFARICVRAAELANEAEGAMSVAVASASAAADDCPVLGYASVLARVARARACRFFGIEAEEGGRTGEGIAWLRAGREVLLAAGRRKSLMGANEAEKEKSKLGLRKWKEEWKGRKEERRAEKNAGEGEGSSQSDNGLGAGDDAGRMEEVRVLEWLSGKWEKMNDTINTQNIPPHRPLLAQLPSGRDILPPLKVYVPDGLEKGRIETLRGAGLAPGYEQGFGDEDLGSSSEEGEIVERRDYF
ncbi:hypothetical protein KEM54_002224 [Ascosphaera aggregata]|nr:hypothetical protein KEM54_002224 [Ascosphaera aggregata]